MTPPALIHQGLRHGRDDIQRFSDPGDLIAQVTSGVIGLQPETERDARNRLPMGSPVEMTVASRMSPSAVTTRASPPAQAGIEAPEPSGEHAQEEQERERERDQGLQGGRPERRPGRVHPFRLKYAFLVPGRQEAEEGLDAPGQKGLLPAYPVIAQSGSEFARRALAPFDGGADGLFFRPRFQAIDPVRARSFGRHDLIEVLSDPDRRSRVAGPVQIPRDPGPEPGMGSGETDLSRHMKG
ncbi:MAG: hypothetical protein M0C28_01200 [Candidatus Moduliflexus flocculans]|nr:hypothetical protein [Candidatus Moduliflexus flocculans]